VSTTRSSAERPPNVKLDSARMLATKGSVVVVTQKLSGRASPDDSAPVAATVEPGTVIKINGVAYNQGKSWLQIEHPSGRIFLPGSERITLSQSRVGFSLREIEVPPDAYGLPEPGG
jgi:hypothetical protein